MKNKKQHQGELLKKLIEEHNPSRERLAEFMGITSSYLYKMYLQENLKTVFFVQACQYMNIDPLLHIEIDSDIASFLKQEQKEKNDYKKIIEIQDDALKMYKLNKQQEERISQLEEELSVYKKRDTKAS